MWASTHQAVQLCWVDWAERSYPYETCQRSALCPRTPPPSPFFLSFHPPPGVPSPAFSPSWFSPINSHINFVSYVFKLLPPFSTRSRKNGDVLFLHHLRPQTQPHPIFSLSTIFPSFRMSLSSSVVCTLTPVPPSSLLSMSRACLLSPSVCFVYPSPSLHRPSLAYLPSPLWRYFWPFPI